MIPRSRRLAVLAVFLLLPSIGCVPFGGGYIKLSSRSPNPPAVVPPGFEALRNAARLGHSNEVRALLASGVPPDAREEKSWTPLTHAAGSGELECARLLLEAGADPGGAGGGKTPLMAAAGAGSVETIRLLLAAGADVNAKPGPRGVPSFMKVRTPLKSAAGAGRYQAVKALRAAGAKGKVNIGMILVAAARRGHLESVRALIADGADVDYNGSQWHQMPSGERPPLIGASRYGHLEIAKALVEAGANVNAKVPFEPLAWAAARGHEEIVRLLIEAGGDLDAKAFPDELTPLIVAAKWGHAGVVRILLDAGADPAVKDKNGRSARDAAGANAEIVALLSTRPGSPRPPGR